MHTQTCFHCECYALVSLLANLWLYFPSSLLIYLSIFLLTRFSFPHRRRVWKQLYLSPPLTRIFIQLTMMQLQYVCRTWGWVNNCFVSQTNFMACLSRPRLYFSFVINIWWQLANRVLVQPNAFSKSMQHPMFETLETISPLILQLVSCCYKYWPEEGSVDLINNALMVRSTSGHKRACKNQIPLAYPLPGYNQWRIFRFYCAAGLCC